MKKTDLVEIVLLVTESGNRAVDKEAVKTVWEPVLLDLPAAPAKQAVLDLIRNTQDFITPTMIRAETKRVMAARLASVTAPAPPMGLTDEEYTAWRRGWRDAAFNGEQAPERLEQAGLGAIGRAPVAAPLRAVPPLMALRAPAEVSHPGEDDMGPLVGKIIPAQGVRRSQPGGGSALRNL